MKNPIEWIARFVGYENRRSPWRERLVSGVGGFVAILLVVIISRWFVGDDSPMIVASMGASAVLLFAVPHGPLSQPWQLVIGHLVSGLIGVTCAKLVVEPTISAALAVGVSIFAMRFFGCIHPPGGATALTAVLGGNEVIQLGYQFVLTPVLLNVGVILVVAVAFNNFFHWRRYPLVLHAAEPQEETVESELQITHGDLVFALSEMDTFTDVSEADLLQLYAIALQHHSSPTRPVDKIEVGVCYSNGKYGTDWQVREVVAIEPRGVEGRQIVRFRVVAGAGRRRPGQTGLLEFSRWAKHRLVRNENSWQRV